MNNVDSLFFRVGIYQVEVPITRSFRPLVPPGKMRPEIGMHLCALAEDLGREEEEEEEEGKVYIGRNIHPSPFVFLRFRLLSPLVSNLPSSSTPLVPLHRWTPRSVVLPCFSPLSSSSTRPPLPSPEEHPSVYRGGTDGIIVRRGPRSSVSAGR